MKFTSALLLGVLLVSVHSFSVELSAVECSCSTYTTQLDCAATSSCEWTNSACGAIDCSTKTTVATCNVGSNCAYNTSNVCSAFTQCSDYKYADEVTCLTIGCQSSGTKGTDGLYPCQTITAVKKCTEITVEADCTLVGCAWANNLCAAPTCAAQTQATNCISLRGDAITTRQICNWTVASTSCADAAGLTQTNCAVLTLGSYHWDTSSSACVQCTGSSYASLIGIMLSILLLAF